MNQNVIETRTPKTPIEAPTTRDRQEPVMARILGSTRAPSSREVLNLEVPGGGE